MGVKFVNKYKQDFHTLVEAKIEWIVKGVDQTVDQIPLIGEERRNDWKLRLQKFVEDNLNKIVTALCNVAETAAKNAFDTAKQAILVGKGLTYLPEKHDVHVPAATAMEQPYKRLSYAAHRWDKDKSMI